MLHGDVKQVDREKVYRDFKSGKIITIVATNVAARGLDFPDIQLVVQTQPPKEVESFIHRSGRTGRAGKSGINVLLYTKRQRNTLEKIQSTSKIDFESLSLSDLKRRKK
jgi:ATP-dependent RNA helicase DDX21